MNKMSMRVTIAAVAYRMALKDAEKAKKVWQDLYDGTALEYKRTPEELQMYWAYQDGVLEAYREWKLAETVAEAQRDLTEVEKNWKGASAHCW